MFSDYRAARIGLVELEILSERTASTKAEVLSLSHGPTYSFHHRTVVNSEAWYAIDSTTHYAMAVTDGQLASTAQPCRDRLWAHLLQGPLKVWEVTGAQHLYPGIVVAIEPSRCTRAPGRQGVLGRSEP